MLVTLIGLLQTHFVLVASIINSLNVCIHLLQLGDLRVQILRDLIDIKIVILFLLGGSFDCPLCIALLSINFLVQIVLLLGVLYALLCLSHNGVSKDWWRLVFHSVVAILLDSLLRDASGATVTEQS